jgi:hypothetical protein
MVKFPLNTAIPNAVIVIGSFPSSIQPTAFTLTNAFSTKYFTNGKLPFWIATHKKAYRFDTVSWCLFFAVPCLKEKKRKKISEMESHFHHLIEQVFMDTPAIPWDPSLFKTMIELMKPLVAKLLPILEGMNETDSVTNLVSTFPHVDDDLLCFIEGRINRKMDDNVQNEEQFCRLQFSVDDRVDGSMEKIR